MLSIALGLSIVEAKAVAVVCDNRLVAGAVFFFSFFGGGGATCACFDRKEGEVDVFNRRGCCSAPHLAARVVGGGAVTTTVCVLSIEKRGGTRHIQGRSCRSCHCCVRNRLVARAVREGSATAIWSSLANSLRKTSATSRVSNKSRGKSSYSRVEVAAVRPLRAENRLRRAVLSFGCARVTGRKFSHIRQIMYRLIIYR